MKQPLIIEVDADGESEFLSRMRKGRHVLNTGRRYNRRANAEDTLISILAAIVGGNWEARSIKRLWCDKHGEGRRFEFAVDDSYTLFCRSCRADEASEEVAPIG